MAPAHVQAYVPDGAAVSQLPTCCLQLAACASASPEHWSDLLILSVMVSLQGPDNSLNVCLNKGTGAEKQGPE